MIKTKVLDVKGKETNKEIELPTQFEEKIRPDVIKKAVESIQSHKRQPYGPGSRAGKKHVTYWSKRRRAYRSLMGRSYPSSRTPRKITFRRGMLINGPGAKAPQTRGGRRAHPPKPEKNLDKNINKKERRKAIRSGISATLSQKKVKERGHNIKGDIKLPLIVDNKIEELKKTKDVLNLLEKIGLEEELKRVKERKIRAGKGKARGRKYKRKIGPLIVFDEDKGILNAAKNIPGVEAIKCEDLNAEVLAPGGQEGRLVVWSENAIRKLKEKNMFR